MISARSTTRPDIDPRAELVRLLAIEAAAMPARIDRALTQLARAAQPLRASQGGRGGGHSDPTATAAGDQEMRDAATTRARLLRALDQWATHQRAVAAILNDWAPHGPTKKQIENENAAYCANHLAQTGESIPRVGDGSRNCWFCARITREYGKPPTATLLRAKDRGRLTENLITAELGVARRPRNDAPVVDSALAATLERVRKLVNPNGQDIA